MVLTNHVLLITVQFLYAIADEIGLFTWPDAIIASLTPILMASVQARTFFSIPNPILGIIAFACSSVIWLIKLPSNIKPFTFVIKITFSAFITPAIYAAALSPSTLRKSNSSLSAIGETIGK